MKKDKIKVKAATKVGRKATTRTVSKVATKAIPPVAKIAGNSSDNRAGGSSDIIEKINKQFAEYTTGKRKKFSLKDLGLHIDLRELQGTKLQKAVWSELMNIPYGKTVTYSELAERVGKPKAVRAVASAVASNPLCIVIPCHRVLPKNSRPATNSKRKSNGIENVTRYDVGQYALGSEIKEILLKIEGAI